MPEPVTDAWGRVEPPTTAGEVETLLGFLDFLRATVEAKTRGLDDEQLRLALPPSPITLGGLLKHLAFVEEYWFTLNVDREAPTEPFASVDWHSDPDWDWHSAAADPGAELRALWAGCVGRSRMVVAEALAKEGTDALDTTFTRWSDDEVLSLRWVLVHMIREYARHCGHADLLREAIDGQTGE